jgi:hypothetical protein
MASDGKEYKQLDNSVREVLKLSKRKTAHSLRAEIPIYIGDHTGTIGESSVQVVAGVRTVTTHRNKCAAFLVARLVTLSILDPARKTGWANPNQNARTMEGMTGPETGPASSGPEIRLLFSISARWFRCAFCHSTS